MKVRYVGPGTPAGQWKTEDLTIGKEYEVERYDNPSESSVIVEDDAGDAIVGIIKGRDDCPFEEYFELVVE